MGDLLPFAPDAPSARAMTNGHHREQRPPEMVTTVDDLKQRLATQPVIEQAKGIVMVQFGIGPDAAFAVLQRWSSHTNRKVRDLSRLIVATTAANPPGVPGRASRALTELIKSLDGGQSPPTDDPDFPTAG